MEKKKMKLKKKIEQKNKLFYITIYEKITRGMNFKKR